MFFYAGHDQGSTFDTTNENCDDCTTNESAGTSVSEDSSSSSSPATDATTLSIAKVTVRRQRTS